MKKGWETRNLGDLCRIRTGKKDVNEGNPDGEFPFFTCAAEHTFSDNYSFDTEALLIAGNGDVGKVSYYSGKFEAYQRTYVLSDFTEVSPRFLYLILDGKLKDTVSKQKLGNTMPYIKVGMLTDFQLPVPPLAEQQRIVALLDEAFEGLATAKANAEKNLQNARAIFESHLNAVFSQKGEGWVETTIGDQLTLQRGFDITKDQQNTGEVPVVSSGGIKSYHDKAMANGPGVVIGRKGTLGKVFYLEGGYWPHDTTLWVKDFKGNEPRFVYYLFAGLDVKKLDSGAANPALNRNQVHPVEVTWPRVAQQKVLVAKLDAMLAETQRLASIYSRKLAALEALKKSLLHQAFSGGL